MLAEQAEQAALAEMAGAMETQALAEALEIQEAPVQTGITAMAVVVLVAVVAVVVAQPVSTSVACLMSPLPTMEPFKEERPDAVHNP